MVSTWPELPSAKPAEPSAGVCDGQEALALCTSEVNRNWRLMDHNRTPVPLLWRRLRGDEAHLSPHRSRLRSAFDEVLWPLAPCEEYVPRRRAAAASDRG